MHNMKITISKLEEDKKNISEVYINKNSMKNEVEVELENLKAIAIAPLYFQLKIQSVIFQCQTFLPLLEMLHNEIHIYFSSL